MSVPARIIRGLNIDRSPEAPVSGDRLESWKEIAAYLNRSERTVRRWEEKEGLPVHRLAHDKRSSVYGYPGELDAWRESRAQLVAAEPAVAEAPASAPAATPARGHVGRWMAAAVVVALALPVAGFSLINRRARPSPPTPHPEAVRAVERVRFSDNVGRVQIQTGIRYLQEAIRHDPSYAPAWSQLATAHVALSWFGDVPARETLEQAMKEAQRALQLDPLRGAPWRVMAFVSHYRDWDHITAEGQFRKALELSPNDKGASSWFAEFFIDLKRFDEAFVYARQGQEVAPRWLEPITVAGNIHLFSGNHELAMAEYQRALEIEPNHGLTNHFLGRAYLARREYDKAIDQLRKSNDLIGHVPFSLGDLGYALAVAGRRAEAEQLLSGLIAKRDQAYFPAFPIAQIQLGLGRTDAGLDWLERAADERQVGYYMPTVEAQYDSVRSHPRFRAILQRMNLAAE